ncbi:hypothetical protein, partial [Mycobacterium tuberculosis]|uniref:hypothetical protein n=1 Tax=Mycobacterium tuberculosis TaxID=1773 RepID=UPI0018786F5E|nr:hypothetical protein [Mycobacterium tuberculosis]
MFLAGVLCMCAAAASALFGSWSLFHTPTADPTALALRAMAPMQLAAAVMLAAGGVVAVAAPGHTALMVVIVCIAGAVGTLAALPLVSDPMSFFTRTLPYILGTRDYFNSSILGN